MLRDFRVLVVLLRAQRNCSSSDVTGTRYGGRIARSWNFLIPTVVWRCNLLFRRTYFQSPAGPLLPQKVPTPFSRSDIAAGATAFGFASPAVSLHALFFPIHQNNLAHSSPHSFQYVFDRVFLLHNQSSRRRHVSASAVHRARHHA